jgi:hypothetical protein
MMSMIETLSRTQNRPKQVLMGRKYKGVQIRAFIKDKGNLINLGVFESAEDAARAYDEAAIRLHGKQAVTNQSMGLLDQQQQVTA